MNSKNLIKNVAILGGILAIATILLTGCGKKKDETKTYDKENEVVVTKNENVTESQSTVYSKSDFVGEWFDEDATELFINEDGTFSADHLTASSTVFGIYEIKDNTIEFTCKKNDSTYGKKWTGKISKSENGILTMNANLYDESNVLKKKSTNKDNENNTAVSNNSSQSNNSTSTYKFEKLKSKKYLGQVSTVDSNTENPSFATTTYTVTFSDSGVCEINAEVRYKANELVNITIKDIDVTLEDVAAGTTYIQFNYNGKTQSGYKLTGTGTISYSNVADDSDIGLEIKYNEDLFNGVNCSTDGRIRLGLNELRTNNIQ